VEIKLLVRNRAHIAGFTLKNDRRFIFPSGPQVAVKAIFSNI